MSEKLDRIPQALVCKKVRNIEGTKFLGLTLVFPSNVPYYAHPKRDQSFWPGPKDPAYTHFVRYVGIEVSLLKRSYSLHWFYPQRLKKYKSDKDNV